MRFWWVNHKRTFRHEVANGYIWCPKRRRDGARNHFYETLRDVRQGDLVFSFADARVQAVGVARQPCYSCPKPDEFGKVGEAWNDLGWRVDVDFTRFPKPLRIKEVIGKIRPLLTERYSPLKPTGDGNQNVYLAEIPRALAAEVINLADPLLLALMDASPRLREDSPKIVDFEPKVLLDWEDEIERKIADTISIPETTRRALIDARRGQGKFKEAVRRIEHECRITRVDNPTHLIASHIKPWRESSDEERLAAGNGLLLTPSIDHLFDRGLITFADDGEVLVSPVTNEDDSLGKMGVNPPIFSGRFNEDQRYFLEYHRSQIFLKSAA